MAKRERISPKKLLNMNYADFASSISKMTEKDLEVALDMEVTGKNRSSYLERIHPRLMTLRKERELEELKARGANV